MLNSVANTDAVKIRHQVSSHFGSRTLEKEGKIKKVKEIEKIKKDRQKPLRPKVPEGNPSNCTAKLKMLRWGGGGGGGTGCILVVKKRGEAWLRTDLAPGDDTSR